MATAAYETFLQRVRDIQLGGSIEAVLDWDSETYMPKRAAAHRAEQIALIAGITHERRTSEEFGKLLAAAERETNGDAAHATNVREMRRAFDRAVKLPTSLVKDIARAVTLGKEAWQEARKESNFAKFAPSLERLLDLKRRVADYVGWTTEPYDALMDEYEPAAKSADVQVVFDKLKSELVPLVAAIANAPRKPDLGILHREAPKAAQDAFNRKIAAAMGFDFDSGRLDISAHPFCSGFTMSDVRITTRYDEKYMPQSLFGVMHEAGHALYEQGFNPQHAFTPMASAVSLGIHESQSRMWENTVGRSLAFWKHFFPALQEAFPSMADVALDAWVFAINNVRPSLIRVEADEVTYGLHIMLRFNLERKLMANKLAVKDVPDAWNDGMKSLLGITPPNDAQGCLQDIHWAMGIYGYFPTYQLGNLYAAQFYEAARKALPDLDERIARGDLQSLLKWLRENIHQHGQRYRAGELVRVVTGRDLSHQPFIDYLNAKYRPLYGI